MPGFHLHTSNKLEILAGLLADKIGSSPLPPFIREIIVVQSKGMQHWLNLELAGRLGISSHIEFPFPKAFINGILQQLSIIRDEDTLSPDVLTWKILQILPSLEGLPSFADIRNYTANDPNGLKRYQLSSRIARVFDQYIVYRPDMLSQWEKGVNPLSGEFPESIWQSALWQSIRETSHVESFALHPSDLVEKIRADKEALESLPDRLSVFGISTLPPYFLSIFRALSTIRDIDVYYLNPCREYWEYSFSEKQISRFTKKGISEEDLYFDQGNSLLASMGTSGREFFSLVLEIVGDEGNDLFVETSGTNLLSCIQSDIQNLTNRNRKGRAVVSQTDSSIRIQSCHSPVREVEVLHDTLLSLFDAHPDLSPGEVVVMMPDVSVYSPLVQAVFNAPESDEQFIPFSIADTSVSSSNGLAETLLNLLAVKRKRFKVSDLLDILEADAVRLKFDLNEEDMEQVREWIEATRIRWGRDGNSKKEWGLPEFEENTWSFGIKRMLLGMALPMKDDLSLFAGILPFDEIEGENSRLLGRFVAFTEMLSSISERLDGEKTIEEWVGILNIILSEMFLESAETENELQEIRNTLLEGGLQGHAEIAGFDGTLSLDVILSYLERKLTGEPRSYGFLSRGVTFCTMLPMRSIPFRVIYLLGMNDGDFPRREQQPGFDLIPQKGRLCDRSKRYEDRYLFLECLISARDHLIISYVGQSIRDNSELPPSVLVSELCDYLDENYLPEKGKSVREQLITRHALQPFSSFYFRRDTLQPAYSKLNFRAAQANRMKKNEDPPLFTQPLKALPEEERQSLSVEQLCRFFKNPAEFLLRNRLGIHLQSGSDFQFQDREPMEMNALDRYKIKDQFLEYWMKNRSTDRFYDAVRASGALPHGIPGDSSFKRMIGEVTPLFLSVMEQVEEGLLPPAEIALNLKDHGTLLTGRLASVYPSGQLFFRPAKIKATDILKTWIHHLVLTLASPLAAPSETRFVGADGIKVFRELTAETAMEELSSLVSFYLQGLTEPLCFFPESSMAYVESLVEKSKEDGESFVEARKKWYSVPRRTGEDENVYFKRCFGEHLPDVQSFRNLALRVFKPILETMIEPSDPETAAEKK